MDKTNTSVWSKKADELTVAESLKVSGGVMLVVTAVSIAIPFAALGVIAAAEKISNKLKTRKFAKELNNRSEVTS
jgi:hypothetical protein